MRDTLAGSPEMRIMMTVVQQMIVNRPHEIDAVPQHTVPDLNPASYLPWERIEQGNVTMVTAVVEHRR
jgi:hypothetical protein